MFWLILPKMLIIIESKLKFWGRISGDYYLWAQKELVDVAKSAWDESVALKAVGLIGLDNQVGLVDIAKSARSESVALKAVGLIGFDALEVLVDIAENTNHSKVKVEVLLGRISGDYYLWAQKELVDVAKSARSESVALKAVGLIGLDNQVGLVDVAKNASNFNVAMMAFRGIGLDNQVGLVDVAKNASNFNVAMMGFGEIGLDNQAVWLMLPRMRLILMLL